MLTYESRRRKPLPVDAHSGDAEAFGRRYIRSVKRLLKKQGRLTPENGRAIGECNERRTQLLSLWCEPRNLFLAREHLRRKGGQAPGPDGIRPRDNDKSYWYECFRGIKPLLENGTYEPSQSRIIEIPKGSGLGTRQLKIANTIDRIIARAAVQAFSPFVEPGFDDRSFGFRPRLGVRHALSAAIRITENEDRWFWCAVDLRNAFDSVPRERLFDLLRARIPKSMLDVVRRLVETDARHGIAQGCPLSPLLLNVYLNHHLDKPWRQNRSRTPLLRYADDILVLCRTEKGAKDAYRSLCDLLIPAGFKLKNSFDEACTDLSTRQTSDWLGYRIAARNDVIVPGIGDRAWDHLDAALADAAIEGDVRIVRNVVRQWLNHFGPVFDSYSPAERKVIYERMRLILAEHGFEKAIEPKRLWQWWEQSSDSWKVFHQVQLSAAKRARKKVIVLSSDQQAGLPF